MKAPTAAPAPFVAWALAAVLLTGFVSTDDADAQALPAGVQLGMSLDALRAAVPDAVRVARPQRLAGGVIGGWHASPVRIDTLDFEPVFFFGPELATRDPGSEIAAWVDGDTDVYAQRTTDARGATVRLVHKARVVKDGRTL